MADIDILKLPWNTYLDTFKGIWRHKNRRKLHVGGSTLIAKIWRTSDRLSFGREPLQEKSQF
jgi:hypothetical protein